MRTASAVESEGDVIRMKITLVSQEAAARKPGPIRMLRFSSREGERSV
jgi:hypothetical protein